MNLLLNNIIKYSDDRENLMNTVKLNYGYPNSEMKDNLQVEIIQEDCRFKFFDKEWNPKKGEILDISDAVATFLVLKGWGRIASA